MLVRMSDWAWIKRDEYPLENLAKLKRSLTIQPRKTSQHQSEDEIKPIKMYMEREGWIGIPRSFFIEGQRLINDVKDEMSRGRAIDVGFKGQLRPDQEKALQALRREIDDGRPGGIVQAGCGWGKTVYGIAAWLEIGRTCLVIVQREFLTNQWKKRLKVFAPDARVGIIRQDRREYGEKYDISIATVQTLVKRKKEYPKEFWSSFGLVITDETHHISAPTWAQAATMFTGFYRLGLTATPRRNDGAQDVFFWHIGPVVYKSKVKEIAPRMKRVVTDFKLVRTPSFDPSEIPKDRLLRFMCANPNRNRLIVDELMKAVAAGRKILVLSGRRKHLEILRDMFAAVKPKECSVDFFVGGRKQRELDVAEKADVILATYQMAKEALDIDSLDTLFLTTPIWDIEQAVGRIRREHPRKKEPIVVDFVDDDGGQFVKLFNKRLLFYKAQGMCGAKK